MKLIVGIDIGKREHVATVITADGTVLKNAFAFPNSVKGATLLLEQIARVNSDNLPVIFGLEATGHYWLALYSYLSEKGYQLFVLNPYQSDAWRKMYLSSVKTDKEDAYLIAEIIRFGATPQTKLAEENIIALRNLSRFRVSVMQQITDTKRRMLTILDQVFPEFESCFTDVFGATGRTLLKTYSTPEQLETVSIRKLTNLVTKLSKGRFKKEKAHDLLEKASTSFGITFAKDSLVLQLKLLMQMLEFTEKQLKLVDEQITKLAPDDHILLTLPGMGKILAASIISEIGDIARFKTSAQLVSFAGINPTVKQSGGFFGTKNHMSKKGSPYLRLALWKSATLAIRYNPILKAYYEQKMLEGKSHMTVVGAVSRKLTGIIFAMLRDQTPFGLR